MNIVWPWKDAPSVKQKTIRPAPKMVLLESLIPFSISLILWFIAKHHTAAIVIFCIALFLVLSGFFAPALHAGFKKIFQVFATWVGVAMSWILLLPFFYIFFTIGHISQLIFKKDPMNRACPTDADTYWIKHPATSDVESYSRQY